MSRAAVQPASVAPQSGVQFSSGARRAIAVVAAVAMQGFVELAEFERFAGDAASLAALLAVFNGFVLIESRRSLLVLLQPSVVMLNYVLLSMMIGALAFVGDLIVLPRMQEGVRYWGDPLGPRAFLTGVVALMILIGRYRSPRYEIALPTPGPFSLPAMVFVAIASGLALETVGFPFAGEVAAAAVFAVALYAIRWNSALARWSLFVGIVAILAIVFADSKRNAVFLLYPLLLLEVLRGRALRLDVRALTKVALLGVGTLVLVVLATAWRVRDALGIASVLEVPAAAIAYVGQDQFLGYFMLNTETTYTYFHVINAIDYAVNGLTPILWGETYVKAAIIGVPRWLTAWKPYSAVHYYTTAYDPLFREGGGSWAVSMMGEAFMNFRYAGAVVAALSLRVSDGIWGLALRSGFRRGVALSCVALYVPVACLLFARGSGLDLAVINVLVVLAVALPLSLIVKYGRDPMVLAG